jgi:imidazoleglycerol-phosphate dehydratase/histidinol-phosphatase
MSGATRKILFVDRDGTLIVEPPDQQIDSYEKFALVDGVIPALRRCVAAGYELVMVTNQDGLGTPSYPQADFDGPQNLLLRILRSQGIDFRDIVIDRSFPHESKDTRKPGVGLMRGYLAADDWSRTASAVIGDRETDLQFAANLGVRGFRLGGEWTWDAIAHVLCDAPRIGAVERTTKETRIRASVDLDCAGDATIATGIGFFDHMLEQIGKHGGFALTLTCAGDSHVDEHHIVEDCALALGEALRRALGDKRGIHRYGAAAEGSGGRYGAANAADQTAGLGPVEILLPMDETIARAALDLSGRPYFVFDGAFPRDRVGELPTELVPHFFRSLCETLGANLHLAVRGENTHHMVEACFKAMARALRQALRREGDALPSTKGVL